jgi:hypothetical protein
MSGRTIASVLSAMDARAAHLPPEQHRQLLFLQTYRRTTVAVGAAIEAGRFEDSAWVERWDVVFADLYLRALDAHVLDRHLRGRACVPGPWALAFGAPAELSPLRHVLLGMNAHINYDLPQALLAVIDDDEFANPALMDRRRRDHERIDQVLSERVAPEGQQLRLTSELTLLHRALRPLNRLSSARFLREARQKVWHNTAELQRARLAGEQQYAARLRELETLTAARVEQLMEDRQTLVRLAVRGFGVVLRPQGGAVGWRTA